MDAAILEFTYVTCMYEMHATMPSITTGAYDDVEESN